MTTPSDEIVARCLEEVANNLRRYCDQEGGDINAAASVMQLRTRAAQLRTPKPSPTPPTSPLELWSCHCSKVTGMPRYERNTAAERVIEAARKLADEIATQAHPYAGPVHVAPNVEVLALREALSQLDREGA